MSLLKILPLKTNNWLLNPTIGQFLDCPPPGMFDMGAQLIFLSIAVCPVSKVVSEYPRAAMLVFS